MSFAYLANTAWMLSCQSNLKRFETGTRNVGTTQRKILAELLQSNDQSDFGLAHEFRRLGDPDEFRSAVPIGNYQSHEPWIDRIAAGEQNVLTSDPVQLLQPTSGSSGSRKLIPYTNALRRQFRNGIDSWIGNLFAMRPRLRAGRSYWSITPSMEPEQTEAGLKIGFDDDSQYLGWAGQIAARCVLAVQPSTIAGIRAEETFRTTMMQLLSAPDLTLISVWSPTFLLSLLRVLEDEKTWLIQNTPWNRRSSSTDSVRTLLESNASISEKVHHLWPKLSLISCWADGPSSGFSGELHDLLPGIEIQPKGLISTEAFASFPLAGRNPSALSIRSHFFEFAAMEDETSNHTYLAHQLTSGHQYRVVVTTGGGLYRYQTGDIVAVEGFYNECPLIRFIGRGGSVSDLVGEKLSDNFVARAIENTMHKLGLNPSFAYLTPIRRGLPTYCLRIDLHQPTSINEDTIRQAMESELSKNPYYEHAVRIGQLGPLEVSVSETGSVRHWQTYESSRLREGVRRGDIKPIALDTRGILPPR